MCARNFTQMSIWARNLCYCTNDAYFLQETTNPQKLQHSFKANFIQFFSNLPLAIFCLRAFSLKLARHVVVRCRQIEQKPNPRMYIIIIQMVVVWSALFENICILANKNILVRLSQSLTRSVATDRLFVAQSNCSINKRAWHRATTNKCNKKPNFWKHESQ